YLHAKAKLLTSNPASELDTPKLRKELPKFLTLEESKRLLAITAESNEKFAHRDYCMLTFCLNCGLRVSELVGINMNHIQDDRLTVLGKGNKERVVYLNNACLKAYHNYIELRNSLGVKEPRALFISRNGTRITPRSVQLIVKKFITAAGLDPDKYSTHKLRHTAATLMYKYGNVDVRALQEILGHENLNTTQIYTHIDNEQLREAANKNPLADL
ncbi:MAG: tyrosine-type recombinase/integrase, partial [Hyphomonadaceae bacterium]|nr:tyrosine-type recombinase/integrase [Clostridia bacterium]